MKNLRKNLKSDQNGITLIALVITIVVLIILSAVTIGSLTGKKGIVTQAKTAKKEYEIEEAKERAKIDISDWIMSQVISGKDSTLSNSTIKSILDGKDYVKQANATSFITKNGEHEILYSDLTTENVKDEDPENGINIAEIVAGTAPNNCTDKIEELGIPLINKYPGTSQNNVISRKVWDMQLYNNRIYIGSGDYNENTGPVNVYYYDIASAKFVNEGTLPDEQINRFVIVNDKLMIPGTDPKESWELGNYFVWENNAWTKKRNLPGGVHNFDLIEFKGNIFAGIDSENDSTIVKSTDDGETFSHVFLYDESGRVRVNPALPQETYALAKALYNRIGLGRYPGSEELPSERDFRWRHRFEAWISATRYLKQYQKDPTVKDSILEYIRKVGNWSVFFTVFKGVDEMRKAFIEEFPGTSLVCFDAKNHYEPVPRHEEMNELKK